MIAFSSGAGRRTEMGCGVAPNFQIAQQASTKSNPLGRANIERFFDLQLSQDTAPAALIETYIEATSRVLTRNSGFFRAMYQRSLAGEADAYWPELRAATRLAGMRLAAFIRTQVPELGGPELDERCVFCLRTVEGMLVHRLLHWKIDEEFDQAYIHQSLARMMTTMLGLPSL